MQFRNYTYYLVDCVNGSDSNDGIIKPFQSLDKVFSVNQGNDLRIKFLSPGIYPTAAQHFSGLSMHWDGLTAGGDVIVDFCGKYPGKRIQFYNCYTHLKDVRFAWDPANQLYFECGYATIGNGAAFLSDVVRFNGMFMFAENASFYRLIVRESVAKLHNITITKSGDDPENAIHSRDSFLTLYGTCMIQQKMRDKNYAAIIQADRGRLYISTAPTEETGYGCGIRTGNTELYSAKKYLDMFDMNTLYGNSISTPASYREQVLEQRVTALEKAVKELKKVKT